jgi:hypothetical protein
VLILIKGKALPGIRNYIYLPRSPADDGSRRVAVPRGNMVVIRQLSPDPRAAGGEPERSMSGYGIMRYCCRVIKATIKPLRYDF